MGGKIQVERFKPAQAGSDIMRVSPSLFSSLPSDRPVSPVRTSQLVTASVETSDVLELSSLGRLAGSLGSEGISALRQLAGKGALSEDRLVEFVESLSQSGTSATRTSEILSLLAGFEDSLGPEGAEDIFTQVEKRGISGNLEYLDRLDNLFSLGHRNVSSLFSAGEDLSDEEYDVFIKSLATLLERGVVGTLTVDYRGQPTKIFLETEIGSDLARAPLYRRRFPF